MAKGEARNLIVKLDTPGDNSFIVHDGTDFTNESGATARTSIGLGTTDTPQFANLGVGEAAVSNVSIISTITTDDVDANTYYDFKGKIELEPSSASAAYIRGQQFEVNTKGASNLTGYGWGQLLLATNTCTATLDQQIGSYTSVRNDGVGTITDQIGLLLSSRNNTTGTVTNYYGIRHLYTNNGTVTNSYFIYDTSGFDNYITGNTGFGTSSPQEDVHAADTVRADTAFNLNGTDIITASSFTLTGPGTLGDGGSTNYAAVAADGEITLHGTARVNKEFQLNAVDLSPGASGPTDTSIGNYPSKEFTIGDDVLAEFEVPHDWATGTDLSIYIYWYCNEAYATNSGEVQWRIQWSACPPDATEALDAPTHTGTIDYGDQNIPATAKYLTETAVGTISGSSLSSGDLVGLTIDRVALDDGSNPTAEPGIVHIEVHYIADKLGEAT